MVLILNDVAGSEILLILVFVLIFFGSKSIPTLARTLGRITRQVKDATSDIQNEIKKSGAGMKKDLNLSALIKETQQDIQQPLDQMINDIDNSIKYEPRKKDSHLPKPTNVEKVEKKEKVVATDVKPSNPVQSNKHVDKVTKVKDKPEN